MANLPYEKMNCDASLARKLLEHILESGKTNSTARQQLYDTLNINVSEKDLALLLQKEKIDSTEQFLIEYAVMNKKMTAVDCLQIGEKKWKNSLHARALFLITRELLKNNYREYQNFLDAYLEKSQKSSEVLSLHNLIFQGGKESSAPQTIALISNCNLDYLAKFLELDALSSNLDVGIWNSDFDNWAGQLYQGSSQLYEIAPCLTVVYLSSLGLTKASSQFTLDAITLFTTGLEKYLEKAQGSILLLLPEPLEEEYYSDSPAYQWRKEWKMQLHQWHIQYNRPERITFCDLEPLIQEVGKEKWFAARYWYHAKLPCHLNTLLPLSRYIFRYIKKLLQQSLKVIVCDLDNTLWGGIVGDDGWQNVDLDPNGSGGAFIRLQALLKHANNNGVILAIASKNEESAVREVFSKRPEMLLQWENFTLAKVNWSPKPDNIRELAEQLNLGLQHFCFLDDSPFERDSVIKLLPDVLVSELPEEPDQYVQYLVHSGLFFFPHTTGVDRNRPALYQSEMLRVAEREKSKNYASYLQELSMELFPYTISSDNIARCEQLLQRTNQFNVTGLRMTQAEPSVTGQSAQP